MQRSFKCNSLLQEADPTSFDQTNIPKHVRKFWSCPNCHQLFWFGSHTERMEEKLKTWAG